MITERIPAALPMILNASSHSIEFTLSAHQSVLAVIESNPAWVSAGINEGIAWGQARACCRAQSPFNGRGWADVIARLRVPRGLIRREPVQLDDFRPR